MPHRLRDLLRENIIILDSGTSLGRADNILIDPERHVVGAVVIKAGAIPETAVVCDASDVRYSDVIAVNQLEDLHLAYTDSESLDLVRNGLGVRGSPLISGTGQKLGRISQVIIDEDGAVIEYRVRRGFLGFFGKTEPVAPATLRSVGEDAAVLHDEPEGPAPASSTDDETST